MIVHKITLTIDEFDNAAMADDRTGEVARILRKLVDRVQENGIVEAFDGTRLMDSNGNQVGECWCDWEDGDEDE